MTKPNSHIVHSGPVSRTKTGDYVNPVPPGLWFMIRAVILDSNIEKSSVEYLEGLDDKGTPIFTDQINSGVKFTTHVAAKKYWRSSTLRLPDRLNRAGVSFPKEEF